jgi:NAD(P)-dependent dehydrogenase (short-subunit alcohol dehydrogenase family)
MSGTSELRAFAGAVALVTGAASGIGAALSRELARRGAVVVLADRQHGLAAEVAAAIVASGGHAESIALDVREASAVRTIVDDVIARHARLDYLFNNAGIGVGGEMRDYTMADWQDVVDVNLMGVVHGVQAAYRRMTEQGFGHIVNTASVAGLLPTPMAGSYSATKHAVVGLSRSLRIEGARYGVRVSALCPGVIRTPILSGGVFGRNTRGVDGAQQLAMWERLRPMDAEKFAREALDEVANNRGIIVVPRTWRVVWWLSRLAPGLADRAGALGFEDVRRKIGHGG